MKNLDAENIISNAQIKKMANKVIERLGVAIENDDNTKAKSDIEILERLQKLLLNVKISKPPILHESRSNRDKIIKEIEARIAKIAIK